MYVYMNGYIYTCVHAFINNKYTTYRNRSPQPGILMFLSLRIVELVLLFYMEAFA